MTRPPLRLEGAPNFRDLGGLPAADGGRVRPGLVYRSEGPVRLTEADIGELQTIGFRLVCDLRSAGERDVEPNHWCAGGSMELLALDVSTDLRALSAEVWRTLAADPSPESARAAMLGNYRAMPRAMAPKLRLVFDKILDEDALPLMIHCTAGKDRTGFAVAVLLLALGVPMVAVRTDYLKSAEFADNRFHPAVVAGFTAAFGTPPAPETLAAMIATEPAYLEAALETAAREWGSWRGYLDAGVGLTDARRARLRSRLVEAA